MKKVLYMAVLAVVALSCSKEEAIPTLGKYTLTGYSAVQTKTDFGTPGTDNSPIPFVWSEGDKIWSGSAQSDAATINPDGSASFSFATEPTETVYYNMTGTTAATAVVPAEQDVSKTLGENGDFGYAPVYNGSFTLQHATAYLWFDVRSSIPNASLEWVKLDAGDVNIAGKAAWNGSAFGDVTDGYTTVKLVVQQELASTNNNVWAMVVLPANLTGKTVKVTCKLSIGGNNKYFIQTLSGKSLNAGTANKISVNIQQSHLVDYSELRVLTFEDEDVKFPPYTCTFDYSMSMYQEEVDIEKWSDYIPLPDVNGGLEYGNGHNVYEWHDANNTELAYVKYERPDGDWGIAGHAGISNFVGSLSGVGDWELYGYDLRAYNVTGGANGSKNFCTHYGYKDPEEYATAYSPTGALPGIQFKDNIARVIDHMYVTNTAYTYEILIRGETDFGGSYELTDASYFKIVAYGYDSEEDTEPTIAEFYLLAPGQNFVTDWTKWDLSALGKVFKVEFNLISGQDGYGSYGQVIPGYFAYDDVAVRFEE